MQRCSDCRKRLCDTGTPCPSGEGAEPEAARPHQQRQERLTTLLETPTGHLASLIKTKLEMSGIPCVVSAGIVNGPAFTVAEAFWSASRVLVPEIMLSRARSVLRSEAMLV